MDFQTSLEVGTYFRARNRGQIEYGRIDTDPDSNAKVWTYLAGVPRGVICVDCKWTDKNTLLPKKRAFKE